MILKIFDYFQTHVWVRRGILLSLTLVLAGLVMSLSYKEDISDFLPLGTEDRDALSIYQDISGAGRMYILFKNPGDEDETVSAIQTFCDKVSEKDSLGWTKDLTVQFDLEMLSGIQDFVYQNIPLFLTSADYLHLDSLLAKPDFVAQQLDNDRQLLMFPSGGLLSSNIGRDPLNLFTPVVAKLQRSQTQSKFEMYDGYIFTPDMKWAVALMNTPFGSSETEKNTRLLNLLDGAIHDMQQDYPQVEAHVVGAAQIAVGNASRIKNDSVLAVSLAAILILALLIYSFRSLWNVLMVAFSIGWGWLFALGGMALFHDHVSIIVIGISSVILGIAVNYPLHLIAHTQHEPNRRSALREIMVPLVVGNVTTVGAFLALVPLQSTALRDLGLFASLLLVGTILFVLLFLPHLMKVRAKKEQMSFGRLSNLKLEGSKYLVGLVVILTVIFGVFSLQTEFDSNMSHINYMTEQQRADMEYFQNLLSADTTSNTVDLYVVSNGKDYNQALESSQQKQKQLDSLVAQKVLTSHEGVYQFLASKEEQQRRIEQWKNFWKSHAENLQQQLSAEAAQKGFASNAFSEFQAILNANYQSHSFSYFEPLTSLVFSGNLSADPTEKRYTVVDKVKVQETELTEVKSLFKGSFDVASMNSALANSLSNDFNYIGWACSFIVFFFLWFSFGSLELAILSFLPMAVSWLWILGLMALLGIKFNIVNIILATFIFGQGDDYTIFMTEGCQYEYAYRKPLLASYKNSIILSALIMFIGIGTLIFAQHPAMKSLAEVTIVGMFSVVLMAYLIPPLIFKWLVTSKGQYRKRPLSFSRFFYKKEDAASLVLDRYRYKGSEITATVKKHLKSYHQEPNIEGDILIIEPAGYGELALLEALNHPQKTIYAVEENEMNRELLIHAAEGIVTNLVCVKAKNEIPVNEK